MRVFRLCKKNFVTLDGEGAKLWGGRWNLPGYPMVYTSTQLSLALLELLVHTDVDLIPTELVSLEIDLPDVISSERLNFPPAWLINKENYLLQEAGTDWLKAQRSALLLVPSVIVPNELNVLINPLHPQASLIKLIQQQDFQFDTRLL